MTYETLTVARENGVERLALNRPEVRNAFNERMITELTAWAATARADAEAGELRAVVLSGAGPSFCAGADLDWMARSARLTEAENREDALAAARMFAALNALPLVLIGRVHGAAMGGGAGLAAVCDAVVAERETMFAFSEVRLGIIPAVIAPYALLKIGPSAARELFLTGARFTAARAHDIGLVHAVVPPSELDGRVEGVVREVLAAGPQAVAAAKSLIARLAGAPVDADIQALTSDAIAQRRVSAEGQEGLAAFLAKRKPTWSGGS